ncbi:hypothetical protein F5I97DRAFT_1380503 [Phlebopus sp. FC_14]|nr:hypothetical protein F5I97DRAFT_1380503 [Phlebopus sp. FC_14]
MLENGSQDVYEVAPRIIILCFDGTGGHFDGTNTNVVKFYGLLHKNNPNEQLCYYQAGVGTYFAPGIVSPLFTWFARMMDEAVAWYLGAHVMGGYKYLMDNYRPGDKVCLFGFSRGAYTARALAGMLTKVGLLPRDNVQQILFAYKAYARTDKKGIELAAGFKKTFCQDVKVDFMGLWDTVQSTGLLMNRSLPFTDCNASIRVFRHALSLDEHRGKFRPNLYHRPQPDCTGAGESRSDKATRLSEQKDAKTSEKRDSLNSRKATGYGTFSSCSALDEAQSSMITRPNESPQEPDSVTDVLEVWFAGCHSDIGGGNVADSVDVSLAQITLRWMVEQVIDSQCGILFDNDALAEIGITAPSSSVSNDSALGVSVKETLPLNKVNGDSLGVALAPTRDEQSQVVKADFGQVPGFIPDPSTSPTRAPSGSDTERSHAIAPLYDQLQIQKLWWLLEIIPLPSTWQDGNGAWHKEWSIHLGKARVIPYQQPKFHRTVKERMDNKLFKYTPRAIYDHNAIFV